MHRLVRVILALLLTSNVWAADTDSLMLEGDVLVDSYFQALKNGDTQTVKSIFGSNLLEKYQDLLDNSMYPQMLIDKYTDSGYSISSKQFLDNHLRYGIQLTVTGYVSNLFLIVGTESGRVVITSMEEFVD